MLTSKLMDGFLNLTIPAFATIALSSKRVDRSALAVSLARSVRALPVTGSFTLFIGICGLATTSSAEIRCKSN